MRIVRAIAVILTMLTAACINHATPPSSAPANFSVTAGNGQVILTWDSDPSLTYWVLYKEGSSVSPGDSGIAVKKGITSPFVVSGLKNGTQYSFIVNATQRSSKAGPATPVLTVTPRLVGPAGTWAVGAGLSANALRNVAYGNNAFVTVGDGGTILSATYSYTTSSGVTAAGWSQPAGLPSGFPGALNLTTVIYDGAQFVVMAADGTLVTSTDGKNWTVGSHVGASMQAMAFGAGVYVTVGSGGLIRTTNSATSGSWTPRTSSTVQDLNGVAYANGQFVAVGAGGAIVTSPDGVTWTLRSSGTSNALWGMAYGATVFVAVGEGGVVVTSPDGIVWTPQIVPGNPDLRSVVFGPDAQFMAAGSTGAVGTLMYSATAADGSWSVINSGTGNLFGLAAAAGSVYVAVGAAGANVTGK